MTERSAWCRWRREVEVNLRGPFRYAKAVFAGMIARRHGRISLQCEQGRAHSPKREHRARSATVRLRHALVERLAVQGEGVGVGKKGTKVGSKIGGSTLRMNDDK